MCCVSAPTPSCSPQTSSSPRCPRAAPPRGTQHRALCARTHSACKHRAREAHVQGRAVPGRHRCHHVPAVQPRARCHPCGHPTSATRPCRGPSTTRSGSSSAHPAFRGLADGRCVGQNLTDPNSCCSPPNCPRSVHSTPTAAQEAAEGHCERLAGLTQPAGRGCATSLWRNCGKTEKELLTLKTRTGKMRGGRKAQALERPQRVSAGNEEVYEL